MTEDLLSRQVDRRTFLRGAGAVVAAAAVPLTRTSGAWAGLTRPAAAKPLKIGNLLTLSGANASASIDVKKGFVTYVLAHDHRIGGRRIQFVDADDAQDPNTAIQQVQKLVNEEHVDVIEGIFFSNVLLGVRDTIDSLKVPTIVANAAANAISRDRKSNYMFRTSYTNYDLGAALGKWAVNAVTKDGMVVVAANYAAGQESSAAFTSVYKAAGGSVSGDTIFVPFPTVPDYQPYLAQIQDRGAKAVWIFTGSGAESIKFITQYTQFGLAKIPLIGNNNLTDPQSVIDAVGDAGVGIRTSANWAPTLKNPENVKFLAAYKKFGGTPSAFAELGYIAAQFLDVALKKLHGDTSNKARFLNALANVGSFQSPGGILTMDPATHQIAYPAYVRKVVKVGGGYTEQLTGNLGVMRDPGA